MQSYLHLHNWFNASSLVTSGGLFRESSQRFKMERFQKIVNGQKSLIIFLNRSVLDV